jgi:hypothetical protein
VGRFRQGTLVSLGSILAGFGQGAYVLLSWPEPTTRIVRLPYGESLPKTPPPVLVQQQASVEKTVSSAAGVVTPPQAQPVTQEPVERELASPQPVPSETETDDGYVQESPEQLGATPRPGMDPDAAATP